MADRLHVHVPFRRLGQALPLLLEKRLQPEIAFLGPDLDGLDIDFLQRSAEQLAAASLAVTVHAPFMDLNPGAQDPLIRRATELRFGQTLEAARLLNARLAVFHPGFDKWRYGLQDRLWLEPNLSFWPPLLEQAAEAGCRVALENIFEAEPSTLTALFDQVDSPWLGHCFDVGHWRLFGQVSLEEWFAALGSRMIHLHLHDNCGDRDAHLPVGEGDIDFSRLFQLIKRVPVCPSLTLEAHDEQSLSRSLAGIAPFLAR